MKQTSNHVEKKAIYFLTTHLSAVIFFFTLLENNDRTDARVFLGYLLSWITSVALSEPWQCSELSRRSKQSPTDLRNVHEAMKGCRTLLSVSSGPALMDELLKVLRHTHMRTHTKAHPELSNTRLRVRRFEKSRCARTAVAEGLSCSLALLIKSCKGIMN